MIKRVNILIKINKNKYYNFRFNRNKKYNNKYIKKSKINVIKNLDFRNEISLGDIILFNNYIYKDKFVKYFGKI
ncbi:ribosomal protein S17 (apicoplast) [Babesia microti strain RI]|uniref:Ribosomal protein S17 n=1 Tax=Babesia microti (strain RI) TaxID=1133968 RepID=A0A068W686_BABMR|nr:ribosomal protein S17 [Babesia microti strain RI]CDR32592.1 ribosomal protein S17 [Babesia microti strain RI]|eukprot:YP_009363161.1 ribosomal protein S17 (apicoplast) [Babesia microti strain RI]